ncbi:MAG TPA: manganese efflux pump [candidate division Zixibacteria bacterium]|nr:manganese efflux pump [candidate division Zixibacteria bacterium]HEQ98466.1 manganese efflux pump [candidate division Zixibacteria bacterium]
MNLIVIIGIAVGLAMDAFAVAISASAIIGKITGRHVFRLGFHFGLFQAMMPVIGWLAGSRIQKYIAPVDHWIAFGLLAFIGIKAIYGALTREIEPGTQCDPSRGVSLVMLSVATSIDALAVGLSFAMLNINILYPALIIGVITGAITIIGMVIGSSFGAKLGKPMEIIGGLVLIGIGVKILIEHLMM